MRIFIVLLFVQFLFVKITIAQDHKTPLAGTLQGTVRDSVYDYVLSLATVSLYTPKDTGLLKFQLTDKNGYFYFDRLPLNTELLLSITYVN